MVNSAISTPSHKQYSGVPMLAVYLWWNTTAHGIAQHLWNLDWSQLPAPALLTRDLVSGGRPPSLVGCQSTLTMCSARVWAEVMCMREVEPWNSTDSNVLLRKKIICCEVTVIDCLAQRYCDTVDAWGCDCLCGQLLFIHDDVIKWKHIPRHWPFVGGIHRPLVNSPHKGQCRRALMFPLICAWINGLANNRDARDLRRHRAHHDVTVISQPHQWRYCMDEIHCVWTKPHRYWGVFTSRNGEFSVVVWSGLSLSRYAIIMMHSNSIPKTLLYPTYC